MDSLHVGSTEQTIHHSQTLRPFCLVLCLAKKSNTHKKSGNVVIYIAQLGKCILLDNLIFLGE